MGEPHVGSIDTCGPTGWQRRQRQQMQISRRAAAPTSALVRPPTNGFEAEGDLLRRRGRPRHGRRMPCSMTTLLETFGSFVPVQVPVDGGGHHKPTPAWPAPPARGGRRGRPAGFAVSAQRGMSRPEPCPCTIPLDLTGTASPPRPSCRMDDRQRPLVMPSDTRAGGGGAAARPPWRRFALRPGRWLRLYPCGSTSSPRRCWPPGGLGLLGDRRRWPGLLRRLASNLASSWPRRDPIRLVEFATSPGRRPAGRPLRRPPPGETSPGIIPVLLLACMSATGHLPPYLLYRDGPHRRPRLLARQTSRQRARPTVTRRRLRPDRPSNFTTCRSSRPDGFGRAAQRPVGASGLRDRRRRHGAHPPTFRASTTPPPGRSTCCSTTRRSPSPWRCAKRWRPAAALSARRLVRERPPARAVSTCACSAAVARRARSEPAPGRGRARLRRPRYGRPTQPRDHRAPTAIASPAVLTKDRPSASRSIVAATGSPGLVPERRCAAVGAVVRDPARYPGSSTSSSASTWLAHRADQRDAVLHSALVAGRLRGCCARSLRTGGMPAGSSMRGGSMACFFAAGLDSPIPMLDWRWPTPASGDLRHGLRMIVGARRSPSATLALAGLVAAAPAGQMAVVLVDSRAYRHLDQDDACLRSCSLAMPRGGTRRRHAAAHFDEQTFFSRSTACGHAGGERRGTSAVSPARGCTGRGPGRTPPELETLADLETRPARSRAGPRSASRRSQMTSAARRIGNRGRTSMTVQGGLRAAAVLLRKDGLRTDRPSQHARCRAEADQRGDRRATPPIRRADSTSTPRPPPKYRVSSGGLQWRHHGCGVFTQEHPVKEFVTLHAVRG